MATHAAPDGRRRQPGRQERRQLVSTHARGLPPQKRYLRQVKGTRLLCAAALGICTAFAGRSAAYIPMPRGLHVSAAKLASGDNKAVGMQRSLPTSVMRQERTPRGNDPPRHTTSKIAAHAQRTPLKSTAGSIPAVSIALDEEMESTGRKLIGTLLGLVGVVIAVESSPVDLTDDSSPGLRSLFGPLMEHHASVGEDCFLVTLLLLSVYCLWEFVTMQMKCPHLEAKLHTAANAVAMLFTMYGVAVERIFRESPDLWWGVLTPAVYLVSNLTMTRLMAMYKGPQAYHRLFELGQSFTLSFQGIHLLAWSSVYPGLFWLAMPFW
eukprot:TRINITY_DN14649_c0_g1_i2.p1 TRINITY_DN14649_c0_g1~~TRINITY_DN14649_c0_g1_i2.p1  ORF type:complete len:323 (-),score=15.91 TRINITY_DN14649_c0_g1_i2:109-1077(-)